MRAVTYVLASIILWAPRAIAWEDNGHQITAVIAYDRLTPQSRDILKCLFHGYRDDGQSLEVDNAQGLANIAIRADVWKGRDVLPAGDSDKWHYDHRHWHFDARPLCPVAEQSFCENNECASKQLDADLDLISNSSDRAQMRDAVILFVHILGDAHNPLHEVNNYDDGASSVTVNGANYHIMWRDAAIRVMRGRDVITAARNLEGQFKERLASWQKGAIGEWIDESHEIGKEAYFRLRDGNTRLTCPAETSHRSFQLNQDGVIWTYDRAAEQLTKAGVRIAGVLNAYLGNSSVRKRLSCAAGEATPPPHFR